MYDDHKVANWITEEGFVYLGPRFQELGIETPTRFRDLMNEKLARRITFPDINVNTAVNPTVGFAIDFGGDVDNLEPGLKAIRELDVHSFWSSGTQVTQLFQTGDIWAAVTHAGWGVRLFDAGVPVCIVHPQVGKNRGMISRGYAAVVTNSQQPEAAE
jgi:spermidine/putrescine-binding protein